MRLLFITDIHGCYDAMMKLLEKSKYSPTHDQLVVGGDMIDRGKQSGKVIQEIKKLHDCYPSQVHPIIGNHEEMMEWYLWGKSRMWLANGGLEAIQSFNQTFPNEATLQEHLQWAYELPLVYETDTHVFSHAGLDWSTPLHHQSRDILWMSKKEMKSYTPAAMKEMIGTRISVHGHTPGKKVEFDGYRIFADLGAGTLPKGAQLALVDVYEKMYWAYSFQTGKIKQYRIEHVI